MKRAHDAFIAGPAPRHPPVAIPFSDPGSPVSFHRSASQPPPPPSSSSASGPEAAVNPVDGTPDRRPEARQAADQWLNREKALRWLSAADEIAYLNATAQQQQMAFSSPSMSVMSPPGSVTSVPLAAPDYFGSSPAGISSAASPMSSVPATPNTNHGGGGGPQPLDHLDCPQFNDDHSLEFEIQRDMGMVWREHGSAPQQPRPKSKPDCPHCPHCTPQPVKVVQQQQQQQRQRHHSPAILFADTLQGAAAAYLMPYGGSPEWTGSLFPGASSASALHYDMQQQQQQHMQHAPQSLHHYGPVPMPPSFHPRAAAPVYAFSDWSGHTHIPPAPQQRRRHLDPGTAQYEQPFM